MELVKGQKVVIVGVGNNARRSTPIYEGVVEKIGRVWFTVSCKENTIIEQRERFNLKTGYCDGGNYMSEWKVFLTEEDYKESIMESPKRREVERKLNKLTYKELVQVEGFINVLKGLEDV